MKVRSLSTIVKFVQKHKSSSKYFVSYWKLKAAEWISEDSQHLLGCENATGSRCCWAQLSFRRVLIGNALIHWQPLTIG